MSVASALTPSGGYQYAFQIEVSEGGGVPATIDCVDISYTDDFGPYDPLASLCGPDGWPEGNVIPANGARKTKSVVVEEQSPFQYYKAFVAWISFRDGTGLEKSFFVHAVAPPMPEPAAGARFGLTGRVIERGVGPLADVTIQVMSGRNAGRQTTTNRDGEYNLTGLQADTFAVQFSRTGFVGTGTSVELRSNRTLHYQLVRNQ